MCMQRQVLIDRLPLSVRLQQRKCYSTKRTAVLALCFHQEGFTLINNLCMCAKTYAPLLPILSVHILALVIRLGRETTVMNCIKLYILSVKITFIHNPLVSKTSNKIQYNLVIFFLFRFQFIFLVL